MASASAAEDSGGGGGQGGGPTALTGPGAGNGQLSSAATSDQGAVSSDPFAVLSSEPSHGDETGLEGGQAAPGVPQQPVLATRTNTGSTLEKDLNNTYHGAYHPHFDHALSQEGVISSPTKSTYAQLTSSLRQRASFLASGPHLELKRTPTWQRMLLLKTVGLVGGLSLLSNNMLGPGLVTVPLLFQDAGWVLPVVAFIIYGSVAAFASLFIVEAMQSVPGNRRFKGIVEFSTLISFCFGNIAAYIAQIILFLSLQSTNVASIIISIQTMDNILIEIFKKTCGLVVQNGQLVGVCVTTVSASNSPFGDDFVLFSFGLLVTLVLVVPLGLTKVADNIFVQVIATVLTLVIFITWAVTFANVGLEPSRLVPIRTSGLGSVFGTVLFNYAYVTTIPSWVNVRAPSVSISRSIWSITFSSIALYILVGALGSLAFVMPENSNILTVINSSSQANVWTRITAYMFPVASLMTSIPIFVIIVYQNLIQNNICGRVLGVFLSAILPFLVAIPLQSGAGLQQFIVWSSLIATSSANFLLPLLVYLKSKVFLQDWTERGGMCLSQHQRDLLLAIHPWSKTVVAFIQDLEAVGEEVEVEDEEGDEGGLDGFEVEDDYKFASTEGAEPVEGESQEGLIFASDGEPLVVRPATPETPMHINVVPPEDDSSPSVSVSASASASQPGTGSAGGTGTGSGAGRASSRERPGDYFGEGPWSTVAPAAATMLAPTDTPTPMFLPIPPTPPSGESSSEGFAGLKPSPIPSAGSSGVGDMPPNDMRLGQLSRTRPSPPGDELPGTPGTPGTSGSGSVGSRGSLSSRRKNIPVGDLHLGGLSNFAHMTLPRVTREETAKSFGDESATSSTPRGAAALVGSLPRRPTPSMTTPGPSGATPGLSGLTVPAVTPGWHIRQDSGDSRGLRDASTPVSPISPWAEGGHVHVRSSSQLLAVPPVFGNFRDDPLTEDDWHIPKIPSGALVSRGGSIFAFSDKASQHGGSQTGTSSPGGPLDAPTGQEGSGDIRSVSRGGSGSVTRGKSGSILDAIVPIVPTMGSSPPRTSTMERRGRRRSSGAGGSVNADQTVVQIEGTDVEGRPRRRSSVVEAGGLRAEEEVPSKSRSKSPSPSRVPQPPPLVVPPATLARERKRTQRGKSNFLAEELNNALTFTEMKGSLFGIAKGPVVPMTPATDEPPSLTSSGGGWDRGRTASSNWNLSRLAASFMGTPSAEKVPVQTSTGGTNTTMDSSDGAPRSDWSDEMVESGPNPRAELEAWERAVGVAPAGTRSLGRPTTRGGSGGLQPIDNMDDLPPGPGTPGEVLAGGAAARRRRNKSGSMLRLTLPPLVVGRATSSSSIQSGLGIQTAKADVGTRESYFMPAPGPMSAIEPRPTSRSRLPDMIPRPLPPIEPSPIGHPDEAAFEEAQEARPGVESSEVPVVPVNIGPAPTAPTLTVESVFSPPQEGSGTLNQGVPSQRTPPRVVAPPPAIDEVPESPIPIVVEPETAEEQSTPPAGAAPSSAVKEDLGISKSSSVITTPTPTPGGPEKTPLSGVSRLFAPRIPMLPETPIHESFPSLRPLPIVLRHDDIDPAARWRQPYSDEEEEVEAPGQIHEGLVPVEEDAERDVEAADFAGTTADVFGGEQPQGPGGGITPEGLMSPTTLGGSEKQLPLTFRSAEFHTLPKWFPVSDAFVAYASFVLLSLTVLGVFVYNIVLAARPN